MVKRVTQVQPMRPYNVFAVYLHGLIRLGT